MRALRVNILSPAGEKTGTVNLPADIFEAAVSVPLMHQVVVAQLAARRQGTHKTKSRGEVHGGGKKPYRQKGTGRARQGSSRAPQFAGGGVVHGPAPRDYSPRTPKKMKSGALRSALTDRAHHARIHVVTAVTDTERPSTKAARNLIGKVTEHARILLVVERSDEVSWLSARNLPQVHILEPGQLNTYDVLVSDDVIFTQAALEAFLESQGSPAEVLDVTDAETSDDPEFARVMNSLPSVPERRGWLHSENEEMFNELAHSMPASERELYWTLRISEELERWARTRQLATENEHLSVGYLDPEIDEIPEAAFGAIVYFHVEDLDGEPGQVIDTLNIDGSTFSIVRRKVRHEQTLRIDSPPGGMVACWAHSRTGDEAGWITADHVVPGPGPVQFSDHGQSRGRGRVVRRAPYPIDAALVSTDDPPPNPTSTLKCARPAVGMLVTFASESGEQVKAKLRSVYDNFGALSNPSLPSHVWTNRVGAGRHGDSGALMRTFTSREAVAIYLGIYWVATRTECKVLGGYGVNARQVEILMGMELQDDG
ncbi:50S ribosomal protein L4 [Streptomyces sp. NEAU-S7GS2]|nr:50S ribosomal protein L4 [Streptomyces sp. NEAU-S7GS2]